MANYAAKLQVKMSAEGGEKTANQIDGVTKSADHATASSENLAGAGGSLSKSFTSVSDKAKVAAKGIAVIAAAVAAAGAAMIALVKSAADSAREIQNLAGVADTSVKNFQRMAFAAKTVGVEQDKLADILKDTSDKIGDFMQTGAGPMADFFENIAPKVGVTADQFKRLSAPDALQLYVSSLEKANLSQSEMTFYMEAIASDSAKLLPLLRSNGKEMGVMSDRARDLGIVLSDIDIRQLAEANKKFGEISATFSFIKNKIAAELTPALTSLMGYLFNAGSQGKNAGEVIEDSFDGINSAIATTMDGLWYLGRAFDKIGESERFQNTLTSFTNQLGPVLSLIDKIKAGAADAAGGVGDILADGEKPPGPAWLERVKAKRVELIDFVAKTQEEANIAELRAAEEQAAKLAAIIVAADVTLGTENALFERLEREAEIIAKHEDGILLRSEQNSKTWLQSKQDRAAKELSIVQSAADAELALEQRKQEAKAALSSAFSALMQTESKDMFELGKAGATAMAIINTYQGVTKAFAEGGLLGFITGGAVLIAGMANVAKIQSTQFGSKSGSTSMPAPPSMPEAVSGGGSGGGVARQSNIAISIGDSEFFSRATVMRLIESVNEAVADGAQLRVV